MKFSTLIPGVGAGGLRRLERGVQRVLSKIVFFVSPRKKQRGPKRRLVIPEVTFELVIKWNGVDSDRFSSRRRAFTTARVNKGRRGDMSLREEETQKKNSGEEE